jgi:hypothetical protein
MNEHQRAALQFHCRLTCESIHPRFGYIPIIGSKHSIVLTVNSGWE